MRVPIKGYEGLYEIDDKGSVYSTRRQGSPGGMLKIKASTGGYKRIVLYKGGRRTTYLIHRLVAENFLDNSDKYACVNHKDGDKGNNHLSNLEWCSYSQNMKHAVKHGLSKIPMLKGEQHPQSKLTQKSVDAMRMLYMKGASYADLGREFGVTKEQVANIVKGKHWKTFKEG